jgi:hypothetical protein
MLDPRVLGGDAAWEIIDQLAMKYTGAPYPEGRSASWASSSPGDRPSVSAEQGPRLVGRHQSETVRPGRDGDDAASGLSLRGRNRGPIPAARAR